MHANRAGEKAGQLAIPCFVRAASSISDRDDGLANSRADRTRDVRSAIPPREMPFTPGVQAVVLTVILSVASVEILIAQQFCRRNCVAAASTLSLKSFGSDGAELEIDPEHAIRILACEPRRVDR